MTVPLLEINLYGKQAMKWFFHLTTYILFQPPSSSRRVCFIFSRDRLGASKNREETALSRYKVRSI